MKINAFEEARKNAESENWFKFSYEGMEFVIELDDMNRVNVMELTTGQIYQYDEEICSKRVKEATSEKLCKITYEKIIKTNH